MNKKSRTENALKNIKFVLFYRIILTVLGFVSRTIFIKLLNEQYLGVSSLFSNILSLLSFAELGIGSVLMYRMYKPIHEGDTERIKTLLYFYRKLYRFVALAVAFMGLILIPFLKFIVDAPEFNENIYVIYLLFLFNSVASYAIVYKKSILMADQREYIVTSFSFIFTVTKDILQIIALIITHNYILYLCIQVLCTLIGNILCTKIAEKDYPFIKEKNYLPLSIDDRKSFFKDVRSFSLNSLSSIIIGQTSNIAASIIVGISAVGYAANYLLVTQIFKNIFEEMLKSFVASMGNLNLLSTSAKKEEVFNKIFFLNAWLYGTTSVCFMLLINNLISLWLGNGFTMSFVIAASIILAYYSHGIRVSCHLFRNSAGFFVQLRWIPVIGGILNIFLDIILGLKFGYAGIIAATIITEFFFVELADVIVIYKNMLKTHLLKYYARRLCIDLTFAATYFACVQLLKLIEFSNGWIDFIVKSAVAFCSVNIIFFAVFWKYKTFKELRSYAIEKVVRKIGVKNILP